MSHWHPQRNHTVHSEDCCCAVRRENDMRIISCQTFVQQVWTLDCLPANCSKKATERRKKQLLPLTYIAFCLSLSHILAPKLKLCAKHSTPICYRHQLFLGFLLDGTEEWVSRIGLGARARLCALSYVMPHRQMRRFTERSGLSALCLQLVFLPYCNPGEVLGDTQVGLADLCTASGNQSGISTSFTLPLPWSALMVCLISVWNSCVRSRKIHRRLIAIYFLTTGCCYILHTGPLSWD